MKNMIKPGKTGMGAINLQVRSSAEKNNKLLRTSGDTRSSLTIIFHAFHFGRDFSCFFF
jgi:hypothetical protein